MFTVGATSVTGYEAVKADGKTWTHIAAVLDRPNKRITIISQAVDDDGNYGQASVATTEFAGGVRVRIDLEKGSFEIYEND